MSTVPRSAVEARQRLSPHQWRVVVASVLATTLEWYDFYLFFVLSSAIGTHFFAPLEPGPRTLFALLAFVAGFAVRPLGALVFGALADRRGRKPVFVATTATMGAATCAIGMLPGWSDWGLLAPATLVAMRMVQGLAIGGEYGASAAFMAEHAPRDGRGAFTGWLQMTASLGLLLALAMQSGLRTSLGDRGFEEWGWRLPFLASVLLLPVSIWVRARVRESPAFERARVSGRLAAQPLREAYGTRRRISRALVALFGLTAGQAVLWYTGQFHALQFLQTAAAVAPADATALMAIALVLALPAFLAFGALSDRIGRRPLVIGGCLLAAALYVPVFDALHGFAHPAHDEAQRRAPVVLRADPAQCVFQFDPLGLSAARTDCDVVRRHLAARGIGYLRENLSAGERVRVTVGDGEVAITGVAPGDAPALRRLLDDALHAQGYPSRADPARIDRPRVVAALWLLIVIAAMVYAPTAAALAEMAPTRIRCSAIALPYHLGNGWFGGFLPAIAAASVAAQGEALAGLGYPIAVALLTAGVALWALPETRGRDLERID